MITTSEHLQPGQIDAFADHELPLDEVRAVQQHIADCHPCSLRVLATFELKQSTGSAGRQFDPSPAMLARLSAQLSQNTRPITSQPNPITTRRSALASWLALGAALLLGAVLLIAGIRRSQNTLSAELLDQHLAALSASATPQVLSTDRHTVKPWFEGKLPFSFNLPDATALPPGATLKGADLAYLDGQPAALLIFTIGKHQVSAFVSQRDSLAIAPAPVRSGFALRSTTAGELRLTAVGDVDPSQLDRLLSSLAAAQH